MTDSTATIVVGSRVRVTRGVQLNQVGEVREVADGRARVEVPRTVISRWGSAQNDGFRWFWTPLSDLEVMPPWKAWWDK